LLDRVSLVEDEGGSLSAGFRYPKPVRDGREHVNKSPLSRRRVSFLLRIRSLLQFDNVMV